MSELNLPWSVEEIEANGWVGRPVFNIVDNKGENVVGCEGIFRSYEYDNEVAHLIVNSVNELARLRRINEKLVKLFEREHEELIEYREETIHMYRHDPNTCKTCQALVAAKEAQE